ncbi:McrC family protein [Craterilacuibacter sinensis]|uniref:Restriction endonuclease n=1 Tax=Craterilacuibacter sinensis TaxID=2686017 RepID=A0A845BL43_9NEIS|nr:McrC family protein [Craterilacuibacter sinensis]MXR36120.1 restriction endonuclease [Craterilacuibacter sinensis]
MDSRIVVREYARLTTAKLPSNTLDEAQVSPSAFAWLCELMAGYRRSGAQLMQLEGRQCLRLDSYVGVLESPCGQVIEILPKHHEEGDCEAASRQLLCKLIASLLDTDSREVDEAGLQLYQAPLAEWVMRQFLRALEQLFKRGLRFDYQRIEEEQRFLRGQLDVVRQMRQPPGRDHYFQIRHDVFLPDRPENRLLKSALQLVCEATQDSDNWRLAHALANLLHELPASRNTEADFRQWRDDRLMAHYQVVKSWCELILYRHMPLAVAGDYRGISLLFPMEKLFEDYVTRCLRASLQAGAHLTAQVSRHSLCVHQGKPMFKLQPDLLIEQGNSCWVLDTKWKKLDSSDREGKYGLSQADFYQLFAYGQRYLGGKGELVLIYPVSRNFTCALLPFEFDSALRLHVVPFDLDKEQLLLADSSLPINSLVPALA